MVARKLRPSWNLPFLAPQAPDEEREMPSNSLYLATRRRFWGFWFSDLRDTEHCRAIGGEKPNKASDPRRRDTLGRAHRAMALSRASISELLRSRG